MSITVVFRPQNYTVETHREVLRRLAEVGQAEPAGRLHHQALARDGAIEMVVDIWESPEKLQEFATHLMPILGELAVPPPDPEIYDTVLLA